MFRVKTAYSKIFASIQEIQQYTGMSICFKPECSNMFVLKPQNVFVKTGYTSPFKCHEEVLFLHLNVFLHFFPSD